MNPLRLLSPASCRAVALFASAHASWAFRAAASALLLLAPLVASSAAGASKPFELRDGDRVVFLGDTLMEREKDHGYLELMMTLRFPDRNVTFRNLGWSADTPVGISRVSFDWPKGEGEMFRVLMEQVKLVQPTVVVLGYGMASSFDGEAGVAKFKADYGKLMDGISALNASTRFVLLSPIRHEQLPAPLPNPDRHNAMLASYAQAIQELAEQRGVAFVNIFQDLTHAMGSKGPLTENGIHLSALGYQHFAYTLARGLGWSGFEPRFAGYSDLRAAIVAKNQLFFHRWRPENSTYLFLFRKHEQGRNAQEIPRFDPLIEAEETRIAKLRGQSPQAASPGQLARRPRQNPLPDKPATPYKEQPQPTFQLADPNLEVTLWAENPLLAKPIAMNWDARGRLWVASSSVYPQIEPGQAQDDKIVILEDTNRDGRADQTTVFADGLLIPTGIEPGDGGAYVAQSTELLHFKDTDGDGVADQRRVVLSGFGTEDTHHILHTLRWGPDGQLYMNQSIYIHTHTETPHGVVRLNSGGTLALRPDTLELGVTMKGLVNGWGHVWDDFGQEFQTDGAGGAGINWNFPQATFLTYEGARRIIGSVSPGSYPKFCGLELIRSERFPKEWQGNAVTLDFRANRLVRFEISEQGAGYTTKQHEFLRSTNVTFRPIDVKLGPDGALYIADWSNPIIQHGEVDFRDPRRDRVHGRIWRVGYKGGKDVRVPDLAKSGNKELLDQQLSPNEFEQKQAARVFVERAVATAESFAKAKDDLKNWYQTGVWDPNGRVYVNDHAVLRALWLYQSLDIIDPNVLFRVLTAKDHRASAAAIRVLGAWAGHTPGIATLAKPRIDPTAVMTISNTRLTLLDLLDEAVNRGRGISRPLPPGVDSGKPPTESVAAHPRVRIEALRALARIPTARAAELALSVLETGPVDGFLDFALWQTINDLAAPWAAAVESGAWKSEGREKQLQYALKAIEPKLASGLMAKVVGTKPLPRDGSGGLPELIGQAGGPAQLRQLFDQALSGGFADDAGVRALNLLAEAARVRNVRPGGDVSAVTRLLESGPPNVRAAAAKLAGTWKIAGATPGLMKMATDGGTPAALRLAGIDGLRELGGAEAVTALRGLTTDNDATVRRATATALAATDMNGSVAKILEIVSGTTNEADALALWRSLLGVKGATAALTKALATASLPEVAARAGLRAAREGGRTDPNLVIALNKAGGLTDAGAALTDNEIHAIAYEVTKGNPANGERIYRNKQLGCILCHAIGGAGGKVGPDLTSLGAASPIVDYIVEAVLLPNKKVKEGYNSVQVTTKDGEEVSGNLVRESAEELILRDATAKEVSIPKRTIATRKMAGSLMPAGLVDFITPQERLDLYSFLAQLGKPGPFDATKQNVARLWRINPKVGTANADELLKSDLRGKDWIPLAATVAGEVPRTDLLNELNGQNATIWAATRFMTSKAGPVRLRVFGTASPKAWVDGQAVGGDKDLTVQLPAGPHTFFIKVTTTDLTERLKLESDDATFLTE